MGEVHQLPAGRALFVDERGTGLRATWHAERGLVNLSVWRDDRCVETFHLPVNEVGRLVTFLVGGLTDTAVQAVEAVEDPTEERPAADGA